MHESPHGDLFAPGEMLVGRYRIVRRLGHGGMPYVYEGEHLRLRRKVAIKVLRREMPSALDAELAQRGPLSVGEATRYVAQACEGLAEAHALGIVHRDIKPSNLFLSR